MRIVSLLPSATEIVHALGLGDALVGRSHECDFPPEVVRLPVISRSSIPSESLASGAIHEQVSAALADTGGLYRVDERALADARPDLILTQETCEVCAPVPGTVEAALRRLSLRPRVVSLDATSLDGILADVARVAEAAGAPARGAELVAVLRWRIARAQQRVMNASTRPTIACVEWYEPLFAAGHWVPEMVTIAGGRDLFGAPGTPSARIEWDAVRAARPEVLALMPCGFDAERAEREAALVTGRPGFADLPAARSGRVWALDGSAWFNRPGPRVVEGIEVLAALLHPDRAEGTLPAGRARRLSTSPSS
jgi:iron complex transport system substrate-binding protein